MPLQGRRCMSCAIAHSAVSAENTTLKAAAAVKWFNTILDCAEMTWRSNNVGSNLLSVLNAVIPSPQEQIKNDI